MRMSGRIRLFVGALTTALFLAFGASMVAANGSTWGWLVLTMGGVRGFFWLREVRWYLSADEEEAAD